MKTSVKEIEQVLEELRVSLKETTDYKYALDESCIVAITDQKGIITHANNNFCKISKYEREELIGQDHRIINSGYHSKDFIREIWVTIANGKIWKGELKNKAKDGTIYWVDTTIVPFTNEKGKPYQYVAIRADITERKKAEEKIIKVNRLYSFISAVNQSIVHIKEEQLLLDTICKVAIEIGQFKIAYIGILDERGLMNLVSMAGEEPIKGLTKNYSGVDLSSPEYINISSAKAISSGKFAVENHLQNTRDINKKPFVQLGVKSLITLPIIKSGRVIGVFGFQSDKEGFFDEKEIALLEKATADISFALETFEIRDLHAKNEEVLKESEARFRNFFESATEGFVVFDLTSFTFAKCNANALGLLKYSPEELLKKGPADISPPFQPNGQSSEELIKELIAKIVKGKKQVIEWLVIDGNGQEILCDLRLVALSDLDGQQILASFVDITERKKAEKQLIENELKLKEAQSLSHIGNFEIDLVTNILYWSDEQFRLLGYAPGEIAPSNDLFLSMVHPDDSEGVTKSFNETFATFKNGFNNFRIISKNSVEKHVFCEWKFEIDKNGKALRIFGIVQDVTEKILAEEKIIQSRTQIRNFARHLNKVQEEERAHIAREIHDELGQELVGIKIGLSAFEKSKLDPEGIADVIKDMLTTVDNSIQSLRRIATELRPGILDTLGFVSSIEWLGKEFERKTKIKCVLETNITDDFLFEKDISICFFRVCQEALTNISKYAEASLVNIKILQVLDELTLEITDNGKGISNDKITNPFSMGLLGMKERANNINGKLEILSEIHKGTTIRLRYT